DSLSSSEFWQMTGPADESALFTFRPTRAGVLTPPRRSSSSRRGVSTGGPYTLACLSGDYRQVKMCLDLAATIRVNSTESLDSGCVSSAVVRGCNVPTTKTWWQRQRKIRSRRAWAAFRFDPLAWAGRLLITPSDAASGLFREYGNLRELMPLDPRRC